MVRCKFPLILTFLVSGSMGCLVEDDKGPGDVLDAVTDTDGTATGNFRAPQGVAASGEFLFVANTAYDSQTNDFESGFVTVVRQADFTVVNKITTSYKNPQVLVARGDKIFVLCSGTSLFDPDTGLVSPTSDASLEIIDVETADAAFAPQTVIPLPRSSTHPLVGYPSSLAFTATGQFAYAGSGTSASVFKFDLSTASVTRNAADPIPLGDLSIQDAIVLETGPSGVMFAGSFNRDLVFAIDTGLDKPATVPFQSIDAGTTTEMDGVLDLVYRDAFENDLFVLLGLASTVQVLTTQMGGVVDTFATTGSGPNRIAAHGDTLYVVNSLDNNVATWDIPTRKAVGTPIVFPPDTNPYDFVMASFDGATHMYVTGWKSNTLYEVDLDSGKVLREAQ